MVTPAQISIIQRNYAPNAQQSPNEIMHQMATNNLLGEVPVLASERAHNVGRVADVLKPETVGEVGRERRQERLGHADLVVLVKSEGEGDAAAPRPAKAAAHMLLLRGREAMLMRRGQSVVRKAHMSLDRGGHLGELVREAMRSRDIVVPRDAAALPELRIRRIRGLPAAVRRMLDLVMHALPALVESWMLVHLPHLKVVDFFHHRLPQPNPCIDEPVRYLQERLPGVSFFGTKYTDSNN
jgi:hypothetical protein